MPVVGHFGTSPCAPSSLAGVTVPLSHPVKDYLPAEAAAMLAAHHPEIARGCERHGPPFTGQRPPASQRFPLLVRSIVGQQISVAAADAILGRVVAVLPGPVSPRAILAVAPDDLRSAGLSGGKVRALRALSSSCHEGRLDLTTLDLKGEDAVREELCSVTGIGPWTADMFLMFGLRLPDIWPVGDVALRRGYAILRGLPEIPGAAEIASLGDAYRPYRSVVAWYSWAEIDADPQGSVWN